MSGFGVLVKCASAVPRSVQAGGWSPFRDVYGCVVAKWLHAIARAGEPVLLRGARRVEDLGSSAFSPAAADVLSTTTDRLQRPETRPRNSALRDSPLSFIAGLLFLSTTHFLKRSRPEDSGYRAESTIQGLPRRLNAGIWSLQKWVKPKNIRIEACREKIALQTPSAHTISSYSLLEQFPGTASSRSFLAQFPRTISSQRKASEAWSRVTIDASIPVPGEFPAFK